MRKKRLTKNQIAYNKQLSRIKRGYIELQKQGYRFDKTLDSIIGKQPKRITKSRIEKLSRITRTTLRKYTTAISPKTGKVISGEIAFKEAQELKREARKLENKFYFKTTQGVIKSQDKEFFKIISKKDKESLRKANLFNKGTIVYNNIMDLINKYPTEGAEILLRVLKSEFSTFGKDAVLEALGNAPEDCVSLAEDIVHYRLSSTGIHEGIMNFINIIRGTIASEEERKEIGEVMDAMGYDEEIT